MNITEAECRELLQSYSDMIKQYVDKAIDRARVIINNATERYDVIQRDQIEVAAAVHFLRSIVTPTVHDILISAGWTPPREEEK